MTPPQKESKNPINCICNTYRSCEECKKAQINMTPSPSPLDDVFKEFDNNAAGWLKQHDTAIRNATLDEVMPKIQDALNDRAFVDTDGDYHQCPGLAFDEIGMVIKSLRTKEQP